MLDLSLLPGDYAICRLPAGSPMPAGFAEADASRMEVFSVTWTPEEVSILCPAEFAPEGAAVETPWRCLRVAGPVQLALTGILASIVSPLADARVNIFAFSTYDTDYLLVPAVRLNEALAALGAAGHRVTT
ncbi:ACT domain-containing protein [Dactylosporangium sp. NPDC000555]|uniref:ACT domain-containing protein n=1 Tax=Dactylosporangium sp. NPDC000555 TaxID=3154260 RepID=UPI00331BE9C2